jgi:hypothetical protein
MLNTGPIIRPFIHFKLLLQFAVLASLPLAPCRRWTDLEPDMRPSRAAHYSGWDASQAAIQAALDVHAPIDGLLGFSQGATAAALYLAHTQPRDALQRRQDQLRFAVIIAGFLPRDATYAAALRQGSPALPSLHVHGAADALVPEDRSRALWDCFAPGSVRHYKHTGAHMVRVWLNDIVVVLERRSGEQAPRVRHSPAPPQVPTCSGEFKLLMQELLDDVKAGREKDWQAAAARGSGGGDAATVAVETSL